MSRCEHDAVLRGEQGDVFINIKACNEWDSKVKRKCVCVCVCVCDFICTVCRLWVCILYHLAILSCSMNAVKPSWSRTVMQ